MGTLLSMKNLFWYLENSSGNLRYDYGICSGLPRNRNTIMFAFSYIFEFISSLEHSEFIDVIMSLDEIAKGLRDATMALEKDIKWFQNLNRFEAYERTGYSHDTHDIDTKQEEFSQMLTSSFIPEVVRKFFTVPKLHQLPQSDKHLYLNEIIAGFMDFLLQVLFHQTNISEDQVQRWALVRKELSFLLAVLGDIPFQCTHNHEIIGQVTDLLAEFEMLANEAGSLVYDDVFLTHPMEAGEFYAKTTAWFEKFKPLNNKIKEHCLIFSKLRASLISRTSVVDSFFIIHSLVEDIENLMNHRLDFNLDSTIKNQMKTLLGELALSQSFVKVPPDNEEEKEILIQIRDLTYEAEYLIMNSLVAGNIDVWYLNLRLRSIIPKIKLACIGLQHISDGTTLMKASVGEVLYPTTGDDGTMDENHFLNFNDDIRQRVSKEQSDDMKILEDGYKHLPCNIKPCFLYFAGFPKDSEISKEKLTRLWVSEGFIVKQGNKSTEETAETYLLDLINRKLVLITKRRYNGAIKTCRMQSELHEFCVRKAHKENFIKFTNRFSTYERCQRLCVPSTSCNSWRPFGLHCRSSRDLRTRHSCCFRTMALLKVVEQSPSSSWGQELAFPAQLRYLGVNRLSRRMVANLMKLECIYVSSPSVSVDIPSVVLRMLKLRHLVAEGKAKFDEDCSSSDITEKTNLKTLSGIQVNGKKYVEILMRWCPHLHKLECTLNEGTEIPDLSFLAELESLKMFSQYEYTRRSYPSKVKFPSTIRKLSLRYWNLSWSSMIKFPWTITKLSVTRCDLHWGMVSVFGRLPNLEVLKLGMNECWEQVWETRAREFQNLKCLTLYWYHDLKLWISCGEHFPVLECLVLRKCDNLIDIPSDFANILTLQRIQVTDCSKEAYLSALEVGKQIQVDIVHKKQTRGELILELTILLPDRLRFLSDCMEQYFNGIESQGFGKELTITDRTEDETRTDASFSSRTKKYSKAGGSRKKKYSKAGGSRKKPTVIDQTKDEMTTTNDDGDVELILHNRETYYIVVSYAMQFSQKLEKLAIMGLLCIAESNKSKLKLLPEYRCYVNEINKSRRQFSDRLVKSFIPQVQRFFKLPKMDQLHDKHLNKNEILASFMDFLLQMLSCEVNTDSAEANRYVVLQKELSFLLALLGDIPFQPCTYPDLDERVNNILAEFEMFANEVGGFLFSCVFPIQPMKVSRFHVETKALLEMAKLLNDKIKEHCSIFSEIPLSVIVRPGVVDSFFIVDSLVEDLQSITLNGLFGSFTHDAIKEAMKTLLHELTLSQSFIKNMQDKYSNQEKEGLNQIRDLSYEAEYLISSLVARKIHVGYLNLRMPSIIRKIKLTRIGLQQVSKTKAIKGLDGKVSLPTRGNNATIGDNQFLDFSPDITKRILNDLTGKPNSSHQVILIFGMPGSGKTTIATELYNCKEALDHFDRRAWCVVSEKYSVRALFIQVLLHIANEPDKNIEREKKADSELGLEIHQTLKGRRYLIVLDDVWHFEVLDKLRRYFPDDKNGSRVMITTRNKDVSPSGSTLYELPILSEDQCWDLLEKKVFPTNPCPSHLVGIGKRIAARCSGVPLAVVSIAGTLVNLEKEESEWKRVEGRLNSILLDDQSDYRKIMELSYEHLPHNKKPCFLYFARFPEDTEISTKELKLLWVGQGFVQKDGNKSPEEIAETYLLDLVSRSLVMIAKKTSSGGMKTCRIHDLLHDICIKKAYEENFFNSTNLFPTYVKHQHFGLNPSSPNIYWRPFGLHRRSLTEIRIDQSANFQTMALVKVMELSFESPRVDLPFQLRYLDVDSGFPKKILWGNLVDLEILRVRGGHKVVIPSVILGLKKLKHLLIRKKAKFGEDCNTISETINLRSISRVVIGKKTDLEILRMSRHLQTLKCVVKGETISLDLSSLAELESLRVDIHYRAKILLSNASFPSTIKKLCLYRSDLPWEKMSIIGELPKLEVLKLEDNAFVGEEWETKDDQFNELRFLKIDNLRLKQWISESSHFPSLEHLVLSWCQSLLEIPSDFGYIPTLQRIELGYSCSEGACLSAFEIEEEQREVGNSGLQVVSDKTKEEIMRWK